MSTKVVTVTVKANLSNYGSGTGVQYLLDTTNQIINSLLPRTSITLVNSRNGCVVVNYKPHIAFRLTANFVPTAVNHPQVASGSVTLQVSRAANEIYTVSFPTAHTSFLSYMAMATPHTGGSGTAFYTCTAKVESLTLFSAWCRKADSAFMDMCTPSLKLHHFQW